MVFFMFTFIEHSNFHIRISYNFCLFLHLHSVHLLPIECLSGHCVEGSSTLFIKVRGGDGRLETDAVRGHAAAVDWNLGIRISALF